MFIRVGHKQICSLSPYHLDQFGFIIVAAIAACLYFVFLCYLVFRVIRNMRSKRTSLLHMTTQRRKHYLVSLV